MSRKAEKTSPRSQQQSRWSIFFRNPLLLKIVVWLGSLSIIGSTGEAWANLKPVSASSPEARASIQLAAFLSPDTIVVKSADGDADLEIARRKSPIQVTPNLPAAKPIRRQPSQALPTVAAGKLVRPQHANLLTADNYIVGVHADVPPKITQESIDIHVPAPLQTTIPDRRRPRETLTSTKSRIEPSYSKTRGVIDRFVPETSIQSKFHQQQSIDDLRSMSEVIQSPLERVVGVTPRVGGASPLAIRNEHRSSSLPREIATNQKSLAGLKSNIVKPMKPRSKLKKLPATFALDAILPIDKIEVKPSNVSPASELLQLTPSKAVPVVPSQPSIRAPLAFSQSKPIAFANTGENEPTAESLVEAKIGQYVERLATISDLKITDPSLPKNPQASPELPKQQISLAKNTQMTVGVEVLEANDFADTINPLIDGNRDNGVSRFGNRPGIYYLVAGSGVGVRHRFSSNLEGSVGLLVRASTDKPQNSQSGGSLGNEKATANNVIGSGSSGGSLTSSYGTLAQLTYAPSENVKFGVTYVYASNAIPEIGSEKANQTEGSNNAFGFQTSLRLDPNLAVGGWVSFNQHSNTELNKNIFTWAVTAAIPDLGGKGNLAGIVVGQEPRVIAASNLEAQDRGSSWHLEGFYQIKIGDGLSLVPAIIYVTGSNIDNIRADSGDVIGAIGINFKF
jgi:Carbohydrate-selective porin, OprB family